MSVTAQDLVADARTRIRQIDATTLQALPESPVLIDVREPGEYAAGHLPGAVNLPRGVLEFQIRTHPAVAGRTAGSSALPLLLYCLTGGRSALAADSLGQLGFEDVRSLAGGLQAWRNAGLPVSMD